MTLEATISFGGIIDVTIWIDRKILQLLKIGFRFFDSGLPLLLLIRRFSQPKLLLFIQINQFPICTECVIDFVQGSHLWLVVRILNFLKKLVHGLRSLVLFLLFHHDFGRSRVL